MASSYLLNHKKCATLYGTKSHKTHLLLTLDLLNI